MTIKCNVNPESGQQLEFLNLTILPQKGHSHNDETRRIVRSHAIRDANRRKKLGAPLHNNKEASEKSKSKPQPQSNFTARFRLDKKPKTKAKLRDVDESFQAISTNISALEIRPQHVRMSPSSDKFDPFDTLPSEMGPRAKTIVESRMKHHILLESLADGRQRVHHGLWSSHISQEKSYFLVH